MNNNKSTSNISTAYTVTYRKKPECLKIRHTGISNLIDMAFAPSGLVTLSHIEGEKPKEINVRNGKVRG